MILKKFSEGKMPINSPSKEGKKALQFGNLTYTHRI
jgi:hypothetical protein